MTRRRNLQARARCRVPSESDIAKTVTILVVEDEQATRTLYVATLRHGGYHTITADSGEAALRIVRTLTPDLILLDVMLPGMGGFEVATLLAQEPRTAHIPIVMVSGVTERYRQEQGISFGAVAYLTKPVFPGTLLETVTRVLSTGGTPP